MYNLGIMNLLLPESQPNFPLEDLTDTNAEILAVLLTDSAALHAHHQVAEQSSFLYRIAHPALVSSIGPTLSDREKIDAYGYGIEAYESIATLATLRFNRPGHGEMEWQQYYSTSHTPVDPLILLSDTIDTFEAKMHNTKTVVEDIAKHSHAPLAHFAIAGAAMAYTLEIDIIDRPDVMLMRALDE